MNKIIKNIPNALTISRMIACVIASILFSTGSIIPAIILYLYGAISDAFDGFLARKLNAVTEFGKKLDPISDKLYALSLMVPSIVLGNYSMILPLVLEGVISGINTYSEIKYNATYTEIIGKIKTICLFPTMILGLGTLKQPLFKSFYVPSLIVSVGLQIGSIKAYSNQLKKNKNDSLKIKENNEIIKNEKNNISNEKSYNNTYCNNYYNKCCKNNVKKLIRKRDNNDRY